MGNKSFVVSVSLVAVALCGAAVAAPKLAPPAKPGVLAPHLRPFQFNARQPIYSMPNMTQMPNSHIITAFDVTVPGGRLYTDVSGRVIGRGSPAAKGGIVWIDPNPRSAKPKH